MFDRLETDYIRVNDMNAPSVTVKEHGLERLSSNRSELPRMAIPPNSDIVTRYKAVKEHLYCDLNGEAVVLSLTNGRYYGMNSVGARIWELVQDFRSATEIEQAVLLEYEVEPEVCRQQVSDFLQRMIAEDLLIVIHENGP